MAAADIAKPSCMSNKVFHSARGSERREKKLSKCDPPPWWTGHYGDFGLPRLDRSVECQCRPTYLTQKIGLVENALLAGAA